LFIEFAGADILKGELVALFSLSMRQDSILRAVFVEEFFKLGGLAFERRTTTSLERSAAVRMMLP
jgi:hypothetical protein